MLPEQIKYEMQVTNIGIDADRLKEHGVMVFFEQGAPAELAEFSFLHTHSSLHDHVEPGDVILIEKDSFQISAVGDVVNDNLANLGHVVFRFSGQRESEMPVDVCIEDKPIPNLVIGSKLKIITASPASQSP